MKHLFSRARFKYLRHITKLRYHYFLHKTPPLEITRQDPAPFTVAMLCGHSTVNMGIGAAKSFFRFFPPGAKLQWHDDGSLSKSDQMMIEYHLPGTKIIFRDEADHVVQDFLETNGFKQLASLRRNFILALKFVDVPFFSSPGKIIQLDSDVLCLQYPAELISSVYSIPFESRYNLDFGPAMTYSDLDLEQFLGQPVVPDFNSGLFLTSIDDMHEFLHYAESLLSAGYHSRRKHVLEQTLWAAWCTFKGAVALSQEYDCTFRFGRHSKRDGNRVITQHYCAFSRSLFFNDFIMKVYPGLCNSGYLTRAVINSINTGAFNVVAPRWTSDIFRR